MAYRIQIDMLMCFGSNGKVEQQYLSVSISNQPESTIKTNNQKTPSHASAENSLQAIRRSIIVQVLLI